MHNWAFVNRFTAQNNNFYANIKPRDMSRGVMKDFLRKVELLLLDADARVPGFAAGNYTHNVVALA